MDEFGRAVRTRVNLGEGAQDRVGAEDQIHAGGRGKAGGVKIAKSLDDVRAFTKAMLGMKLVTHQTGPEGKEVLQVLIEEGINIDKELYVGMTLNRKCGRVSIMASTEAKQRGFDEALMLDMNGFVAEGPGANFFFEKDGVLYTPPLGNILPGITRQTVLEICRELELPVVEKYFRPEELFEADSAFFCGTAAEIGGIESIEGQKLNKPWKESMGAIIQEAYQCIVLDKSYSYVIV